MLTIAFGTPFMDWNPCRRRNRADAVRPGLACPSV